MSPSTRLLLNLDGGEHEDEPEELYALADIVHIACGGHAGDERSMRRVLDVCKRVGTRVGAHPSYLDREGFGRRACVVAPHALEEQVADQCVRLRNVAEACGMTITSAKLHGALYHAANSDGGVAGPCLDGIAKALGKIAIVGLPRSALEDLAKLAGHAYLREAFADRGTYPDGTLVPRGQPGAITSDPHAAADRTRLLMKSGDVDTLCVHADTPSALVIARAVRQALSEAWTRVGEADLGGGWGLPKPLGRSPKT